MIAIPAISSLADDASHITHLIRRSEPVQHEYDSIRIFAKAEDQLLPGKKDGLAAYYPFDGNTKDKSKNKNHGIQIGGVFNKDAVKGKALEFNGDGDEVRVTNVPSLNPTNAITLSAWIKVGGVGVNNGVVLLKGTPPRQGNGQYALVFLTDDSRGNLHKISFSLRTTNNPIWTDYVTDSPLQFDTWYHVAATYRSGELNVYVNGQPARSTETAVTGSILTESGDLYIGSEHSFPNDEYFSGIIDEVRIYSRALSAVEVGELFETGSKKLQQPQLKVICWPLRLATTPRF